jgi:hypothetical protein
VRKRGEVPEVPATGTSGTPREVSGVVHGIYFLEKINRYLGVNRYPGPNERSLFPIISEPLHIIITQ